MAAHRDQPVRLQGSCRGRRQWTTIDAKRSIKYRSGPTRSVPSRSARKPGSTNVAPRTSADPRQGLSGLSRGAANRPDSPQLGPTPDELTRHLRDNKLAITEQAGVVYSPLADRWSLSSDMDVNYMVVAEGA